VLLKYKGAVISPLSIPKNGKRTKGRRAVVKRGMASVIHQMNISKATAAMRVVAGLPGSRSEKIIARNVTGPRIRPAL